MLKKETSKPISKEEGKDMIQLQGSGRKETITADKLKIGDVIIWDHEPAR